MVIVRDISIVNMVELINKEEVTYEDLVFILDQLNDYSNKEKDLFSFSKDYKKIFNGDLWVFLLRDKGENKLLIVLDIRTAANGEDFLYIHLIAGRPEGNLKCYISYLNEYLIEKANLLKLSFIMFDARPGWGHLLKDLGLKEKCITYVKELRQ